MDNMIRKSRERTLGATTCMNNFFYKVYKIIWTYNINFIVNALVTIIK